jgi:hypothetical protein
MSALGSLVVKLALEYAEYTRGLDKSDQAALKFAQRQQQRMDEAMRASDDFFNGVAKKAALAVGAYISINTAVERLKKSIDDLAMLDDVAQQTGAAVENTSKMLKVARQFGADFNAINPMIIRLAKGMATVDSETNKVNKALEAIGVNSRDAAGKLRDPAEVMVDVAKRLQLYEDSANKTALVTDLMGKTAAEQLPFLNDLAENYDRMRSNSSESAAAAADLQDKIGGLKLKLDELFTSVALDMVPAMSDFVAALDDVYGSAGKLAGDSSVREWSDDIAVGLARIVDVARILPDVFNAVSGSFRVVGADIMYWAKAVDVAARIANPVSLAKEYAAGKSPLAELTAAAKERNAILADANQRYDDLWNNPGNQMEHAVLARIAARKPTTGSPYVSPGPAGRKTLDYETGNAKDTSGKLTDYQRLTQEVLKFNAAQQLEIEGGEKLTQGQTLALGIMQQIRNGTVQLTEAEKLRIGSLLESALATEQMTVAEAERAARAKEVAQQVIASYQEQQAALAAYENDWNNHLGSLEDSLQTLRQENELYGLTATQIAKVNLQRAEENVEIARRNGVSQDYLARLEREVELRKQILKETTSVEQKRAWTSIFDSIERTAHDTFVSIFDTGKSAFDRLKDTLKNGLLDLLYQMTLKRWIINIEAAITGTGTEGTASAGSLMPGEWGAVFGGGGSGGLGLGSIKSIFDVVTKGFNTANNLFLSGIQDFGVAVADLGGIFADVGSWITMNGSTIAAVAPFVPSIFSLLTGDIGGAISSGIGAGIGMAIGGPVGGAIGSALGSIVGGLFGGDEPELYGAQSRSTYQGGGLSLSKQNDYGKSLGAQALKSIKSVTDSFVNTLGSYLNEFGLDPRITASAVFRKRTTVRGGFWGSIDGQDLSLSKKYGDDADMQASFNDFVKQVMGPMMVKAIQKSDLEAGIKMLFKGLTNSNQVVAMMNATLGLNSAQKELADRFGLTVDQAGRVAKATGLVKGQLIEFVNLLGSAALAFKTAGEVIVEARDNLTESFAAKGGGDNLPSTLQAFDDILKGIDKTTQAGIKQFAELFSIREQFNQYVQTIDGLKGGVKGALYGIVSPAEQQAMLQADLAELFGSFDLQIPGSVQELIELGKSIDYTTAEGLNLAAAFPSLVAAFQQAREQVDSLVGSLSSLDTSRFSTLVDYNRAINYARSGIDVSKLPSYDVGTAYVPADGLAVIHEGERIFTRTENAEVVAAVKQSAQLQAEVRALRQELKAGLYAVATNTGEMAKKIRQWDGEGLPAERTV